MAETLAQGIGCQRVIKNAKHDELSYLLWLRKRAILSPSWQGPELRPDRERLEALAGDPDLDAKVLGIDRGVRILAACSDGTAHAMEASLRARIQMLEHRKRHYQRGVARKPEGSRRREKAQAKVSRNSARMRNIREDFLKKTAHAIAQAAPEVTALEWLNLRGMTRKAKPRRDERTGIWLRNGATCKTALNRALASAGMGKLHIYLEQALRRLGKLLVRVPAAHSSQECSACLATDPGNRTDQETFLCKRCGHAENADHNAARVIRKRGIALILTAGTAGRARTGSTRSDRLDGRGEVRRNKGATPSAAPVKRETPTFQVGESS